MVHLRCVHLHEKAYYYLFYTVRNPFRKFRRYIGIQKPTDEQFEKLSQQLLYDIEHHPHMFVAGKQNAIQLLQDIQTKEGFVSQEHIVQISKELDVPAVDLYGVLTFYSQFRLKKPGQYTIAICNGTACHVRDSLEMIHQAEKQLGIHPGETSADGKCSLVSVNCIGACARAPAMMINGEVHGELTKNKVKQILGDLR